ncbi:MAG: TlpA family protein disulfide reductase, partial [Flavobacterium sp.]
VLLRDPDSNSWIPKVDSTWSGAIPATIIYNKNKRKFYERSFTYEELESELNNLKQ